MREQGFWVHFKRKFIHVGKMVDRDRKIRKFNLAASSFSMKSTKQAISIKGGKGVCMEGEGEWVQCLRRKEDV